MKHICKYQKLMIAVVFAVILATLAATALAAPAQEEQARRYGPPVHSFQAWKMVYYRSFYRGWQRFAIASVAWNGPYYKNGISVTALKYTNTPGGFYWLSYTFYQLENQNGNTTWILAQDYYNITGQW